LVLAFLPVPNRSDLRAVPRPITTRAAKNEEEAHFRPHAITPTSNRHLPADSGFEITALHTCKTAVFILLKTASLQICKTVKNPLHCPEMAFFLFSFAYLQSSCFHPVENSSVARLSLRKMLLLLPR
jgi:hypothetical protein